MFQEAQTIPMLPMPSIRPSNPDWMKKEYFLMPVEDERRSTTDATGLSKG